MPDEIDVYECELCGVKREVGSGRPAPLCGNLTRDIDHQPFPGEHFVRIITEHYEHHGTMVLQETVEASPFEHIKAERHAERSLKAARHFEDQDAIARASAMVDELDAARQARRRERSRRLREVAAATGSPALNALADATEGSDA
jgi:hypothetical protein